VNNSLVILDLKFKLIEVCLVTDLNCRGADVNSLEGGALGDQCAGRS